LEKKNESIFFLLVKSWSKDIGWSFDVPSKEMEGKMLNGCPMVK
jgi:hypothetical protein